MKKIISSFISTIIAAAACAAVFPKTAANAASVNAALPLPANKSYTVTVLDRYSDGTIHESYITEYVLKQKPSSQPDCVIDIAAAANTRVTSVADGVVLQNHSAKQHTAGGNNVVISHNDGSYSYYGHLMNQSSLKVGAKVKKGDLIGYVGKSGAATGYHLHFEWSNHDPYCEFKNMGYSLNIKNNSGASAYPHNHSAAAKTMYVKGTDGSLNINLSPSSAKRVSSMPEGASCKVYSTKSRGNWYYVNYNGTYGYAYKNYLTENAPQTAQYYKGKITGTDGYLVINSKPKSGYAIGYIPEGAYCDVYYGRNSGNWLWVSYNGVSGYAYGKYIK